MPSGALRYDGRMTKSDGSEHETRRASMERRHAIEMFEETREITAAGAYEVNGKTLRLHGLDELEAAEYFSEGDVAELIARPQMTRVHVIGSRCNVRVVAADTLSASIAEDVARPMRFRRFHKRVLALNFANPVRPGGGVLLGAGAQEEDLCRKTTLYASLASDAAAPYYEDNARAGSKFGSDAIVLSPCVDIIRDAGGALLEEPVTIAVLSCAAPYVPQLDKAARGQLAAVIRRRVDGMLRIAVERGYDMLVLGAWGCGAFGNDPDMVANAFSDALREVRAPTHGGHGPGVGLSSLFSRVCFAVPGGPGKSVNHDAFERVLGSFYRDEDDAEAARVRARRARREQEGDRLDKFQGCLVGGAIGDALGYAVEFMSSAAIRDKYGEEGIVAYDIDPLTGCAPFSDDTQMTLFTAVGILERDTRMALRGIAGSLEGYVRVAYLDWLRTQEHPLEDSPHATWLFDVKGLHARRAPGTTCLNALRAGGEGSMDKPINDSKGCGGVMRVAPVGLYCSLSRAPQVAAACAALTHGHPLGWIPAAALAYIVNRCCNEVPETYGHRRRALKGIIDDCCQVMPTWFPGHEEHAARMAQLLQQALELAERGEGDSGSVRALGEGWVGDEALAIAIYACMIHADDFGAAIRVAVNHDGDSDSTGAICGNIMGAMLGYAGIGSEWTKQLELHDLIMEVAKDLCDGCPMSEYGRYWDEDWARKYATAYRAPFQ